MGKRWIRRLSGAQDVGKGVEKSEGQGQELGMEVWGKMGHPKGISSDSSFVFPWGLIVVLGLLGCALSVG